MSDMREPCAAETRKTPVSGEEVLAQVYEELRRVASHQMAGESAPQTIQPTALVHEAWMRLSASQAPQWRDRQHFFATAALAMRQILVDRARRKQAAKRGANPARVELRDTEFAGVAAPDKDDRLLALDEALEKFAVEQPEKARLVRMRYYAGLTNEQVAEVLGISEATAKRWWTYARAWLQDCITNAR